MVFYERVSGLTDGFDRLLELKSFIGQLLLVHVDFRLSSIDIEVGG